MSAIPLSYCLVCIHFILIFLGDTDFSNLLYKAKVFTYIPCLYSLHGDKKYYQ